MLRPCCFLLLALAQAPATRQPSLADTARRTAEERKTAGEPAIRLSAADLPGSARIDAVLGDFVLTEELVNGYRRAEVAIVKARNNAALDARLMKWENQMGADPFGIVEQYRQDKMLMRIFDINSITPRDYVFVEVAMSRAKTDRGESKAARAVLPRPRVANVEFIEKHEGNIGPAYEMDRELKILEVYRQGRTRR